jgi:hypothetical protein
MVGIFLFAYENRTLKPVEIVLRRGKERRKNQGVNLVKIYCKYMCKFYNVSPIC